MCDYYKVLLCYSKLRNLKKTKKNLEKDFRLSQYWQHLNQKKYALTYIWASMRENMSSGFCVLRIRAVWSATLLFAYWTVSYLN